MTAESGSLPGLSTLPAMTDTPIAIISPAERVPGLFNVQVTTGEQFYDLTIAQLRYLAAKHGWTIVPAEASDG
jgi:hypothetical protein